MASQVYNSQKYRYASRQQELEKLEGFFGAAFIPPLLEPHHDEIHKMWETYGNLRLYGELFGPGVNKGVKYGDTKQFRLFDIWTESKGWLTWQECHDWEFFKALRVPLLGLFQGLNKEQIQKLMVLVEQTNSAILGIEDNNIEGFVIKPFDKVLRDQYGHLFYIKLKSEKFKEQEKKACTEPKVLTEYDHVCNLWNELFLTYINKNRLESVISKLGPLKETKQFGEYIKAMMADATIDFEKNEDMIMLANQVEKGDMKKVYNAGKKASGVLKAYLMEAS